MPSIIDLALPISDRTDPILVPNTRSGGVALNGLEQVVSATTAIWKWPSISVPINTVGRARTWRAVNAKLEGRFNYLRLRICDQYRIGRQAVGAVYNGNEVPHSDETLFSDGTGYKLAQPRAPILGAKARGSTTVRIAASNLNGGMSAGVFFSINDYLYVVTDWELAGTAEEFIDISFKPPLRVAATEDDEVDFDATSIWVLDTDDIGKMALRLGRFGQVELSLTEALGRSE